MGWGYFSNFVSIYILGLGLSLTLITFCRCREGERGGFGEGRGCHCRKRRRKSNPLIFGAFLSVIIAVEEVGTSNSIVCIVDGLFSFSFDAVNS
jgi:hypothetical protein